MPLQATSGAASYDAFGGGVAAVPNYIEDVFSTWLYTGNNTTNVISNGINLSGKGGLIWTKVRNDTDPHALVDTVRGFNYMQSNSTSAQGSTGTAFSSFDSTGYTLGVDSISSVNQNPKSYVSWTFREQPKFFDIVTYTGNGASRSIAHNLKSVPGCMIVKCTSLAQNWIVYHRSLSATEYMRLNQTAAVDTFPYWDNTSPTSSVFYVNGSDDVNKNGQSYVAYLFAHDAGGFGLTGTDNVISCGSFTTDGSGTASVTLGYEAQWVMIKKTSSTGSWWMLDTMRGYNVSGSDQILAANLSGAEQVADEGYPTATGFNVVGEAASSTYIYIAIRRGPMKVPTSGTSVFAPITGTTDANFGFPADFVIFKNRAGTSGQPFFTRLLDYKYLNSSNTFAEGGSSGDAVWNASQTTFSQALTGASSIFEGFRRAPSFFDVVCYTGTGANRTVAHNLGVAPEMMIIKARDSSSEDWTVYSSSLGNTKHLRINGTDSAFTSATMWNSTSPTSSVFTVGTATESNRNGNKFVAYLFATCAGVSKVGSYTGTATTKQVDCGFTGGARFVLIKRTDSTGDWYVWDSARGIVSGNDPYLLLNSTAAEVTSTDYIDTYSAGFEISSTAPAAINASGGTYIFLAIA